MARIQIKLAEREDAIEISRVLRRADIEELQACHGDDVDVTRILTEAFDKSKGLCWVAYDSEGPVALFGATPIEGLPKAGSPWLLGTERMNRYKRFLLRGIRHYIDIGHQRYPMLINRIDARNEQTIEWLQRIGFQLGDIVPTGPRSMPFQFFLKEVSHV